MDGRPLTKIKSWGKALIQRLSIVVRKGTRDYILLTLLSDVS